MDVLDDILDTLRLQGALYFHADFAAPWGVTVPDLHQPFRKGADHPLLRALPEYLATMASQRNPDSWLSELLRLTTSRVFQHDLRSAATITRLSEIVFMELVCGGIQRGSDLESVLEAFRDRHIGHALQLMHRRSEEPWTVDTLAREVGMSRSRFAERFRDLMGMGPMAYLSDWRLQKALTLLHDPRASVQQVASQIDYDSPAAFTRAFSSKFGVAPTEYRRELA